MRIISHRGYWRDPSEKNSAAAFDRSFRLGFGTEADFRDCDGRLVIAHDLPGPGVLEAEVLFRLLVAYNRELPLAINIKADGLQGLLRTALRRYDIRNYFLFDMSVPDAMVSYKEGLRVFTRHSDVEPKPAFYELANGVWIDSFSEGNYLSLDLIAAHLAADKQVCLVSPELHHRDPSSFWRRLRDHPLHRDERLFLCSDQPENAATYFNICQK